MISEHLKRIDQMIRPVTLSQLTPFNYHADQFQDTYRGFAQALSITLKAVSDVLPVGKPLPRQFGYENRALLYLSRWEVYMKWLPRFLPVHNGVTNLLQKLFEIVDRFLFLDTSKHQTILRRTTKKLIEFWCYLPDAPIYINEHRFDWLADRLIPKVWQLAQIEVETGESNYIPPRNDLFWDLAKMSNQQCTSYVTTFQRPTDALQDLMEKLHFQWLRSASRTIPSTELTRGKLGRLQGFFWRHGFPDPVVVHMPSSIFEFKRDQSAQENLLTNTGLETLIQQTNGNILKDLEGLPIYPRRQSQTKSSSIKALDPEQDQVPKFNPKSSELIDFNSLIAPPAEDSLSASQRMKTSIASIATFLRSYTQFQAMHVKKGERAVRLAHGGPLEAASLGKKLASDISMHDHFDQHTPPKSVEAVEEHTDAQIPQQVEPLTPEGGAPRRSLIEEVPVGNKRKADQISHSERLPITGVIQPESHPLDILSQPERDARSTKNSEGPSASPGSDDLVNLFAKDGRGVSPVDQRNVRQKVNDVTSSSRTNHIIPGYKFSIDGQTSIDPSSLVNMPTSIWEMINRHSNTPALRFSDKNQVSRIDV